MNHGTQLIAEPTTLIPDWMDAGIVIWFIYLGKFKEKFRVYLPIPRATSMCRKETVISFEELYHDQA